MKQKAGTSPLRTILVAVGIAAISLTIAACSDSGGLSEGSEEATTATAGEQTGKLKISNWPLYIDKQTINDFEKETGIKVQYIEDVNDNDEFFGKVQPLFSQGDSGGRSIVVTSDLAMPKLRGSRASRANRLRLAPTHLRIAPAVRRPTWPTLSIQSKNVVTISGARSISSSPADTFRGK